MSWVKALTREDVLKAKAIAELRLKRHIDMQHRLARREADEAERAAFHADVRRSVDFPQIFDIPGVDA